MAPTTDDLVERAAQLDRRNAVAPPTMEVAQEHALELAELSRLAGGLPAGSAHPHGGRRLASVADRVRNELLACRSPLWELREPPGAPSASTSTWLKAHRRTLRRGAAQGWTTSVVALDAMITRLDAQIASVSSRDEVLYLAPPVRAHREFLDTELRATARNHPALSGLPLGEQCFEARARLLAGASFDAERTRLAARQVLSQPHVFSDVAVSTFEMGAPVRLKDVWRPSPAIVRGVRLIHAMRADRRGSALVAAAAAGTLIDLALHAEGQPLDGLRQEYPWIPQSVFAELARRSSIEPLTWLTTFEGYRVLESLGSGRLVDDFDDWIARTGALEPEILVVEAAAIDD